MMSEKRRVFITPVGLILVNKDGVHISNTHDANTQKEIIALFEMAKDKPTNTEMPKSHIFDPKYAERSNSEQSVFGMASVKAEGGLVNYKTSQDFRLVTEKQFLDAIVNRSNVIIEKAGRRKKHYLYDDGLFAIKHKSKFYLLASVYKEILKGEANNE